jgi:hypothetical protein
MEHSRYVRASVVRARCTHTCHVCAAVT